MIDESTGQMAVGPNNFIRSIFFFWNFNNIMNSVYFGAPGQWELSNNITRILKLKKEISRERKIMVKSGSRWSDPQGRRGIVCCD